MNIEKVVLEAAEEILGLSQEDMSENMDLNLWEEGLLDSISIASIIAYLEEHIHKTIDTEKLTAGDFISLNSIISTVKRVAEQ